MFTGIIEGLGTVRSVRSSGQGVTFGIVPDFSLDDPRTGESIAVNGVCLTATEITESSFSVDVSPETLSRSTLGGFRPGTRVNLERALRPSDRLGGHFVSGHVDAVGTVTDKRRLDKFVLYSIEVPHNLDRYIIEKGSVAVDGISLTVNSCGTGIFSVAIIPHTAGLTTMGFRNSGDRVNIEVDLIGKYIEKLLFSREEGRGNGPGLDREFLAKHGFI